MSKVKIQGNASGTGVLTVEAPNTNTDRTLTLPDDTGTVAVVGRAVAVTSSATTTDIDGATLEYDATVTRLTAGRAGGNYASMEFSVAGVSGDTNQMSIDYQGNLKFNSGYGSVATAYGTRAWVKFNGNNGSINGSGGVSSVGRPGTGDYDVNWTTAMPDTIYAVTVSSGESRWDRGLSTGAYYTNKVVLAYENTSGVRVDGGSLCVMMAR